MALLEKARAANKRISHISFDTPDSDFTTRAGTDVREMALRETMNDVSAPQNIVNAITHSTIPEANIPSLAPNAEEKQILKSTVIQPPRHVLDLVTNTGERTAKPIRMPASAFFNINSIDRYASALNPTSQFALITEPYDILTANPAGNYNMSLGRNLLTGYFHRLTVTEANLHWNIPTINSQNYIFCMSAGDIDADTNQTLNVVIPIGYYSYAELAAVLQTQIRATFTSSAVPLDELTVTWEADFLESIGSRFIFNTEEEKVIVFNKTLVSTNLSNELILGQTVIQANRSMLKFYNMIGINTFNILTLPVVLPFQQDQNNFRSRQICIPSYPTLIYTGYVDIISSKLSQFMRVKDSETSWSPDTAVIIRVYMSNVNGISAPSVTPTGLTVDGNPAVGATTRFDTVAIGTRAFVLNYSPITPKHIKWDPAQSLVDFDIRVVDEFGDIVPWNIYGEMGAEVIYLKYTEVFEFQLTVLASET